MICVEKVPTGDFEGVDSAYGLKIDLQSTDDFVAHAHAAGVPDIWRVFVTDRDGRFVVGVTIDGTVLTG